MQEFSLLDLARRTRFPAATLLRWARTGVIRGTNRGRGRGNGVVFTRAEATEALALITLRRHVPLQRLRPIIRKMRQAGGDFIAVGADGSSNVLLDGAGDGAPLYDPKTRQTYLGVVIDLRPMRREIEQLVDQLATGTGGA